MMDDQPILDIASLRRASRDPVIHALSGFSGKPVTDWLPTDHPAATGQFLRTDGRQYSSITALTTRFTPQQIWDVLAATGPSHCLDGWTFFSRALAALLSGDTHTTRHLAYYAQLRAALSILHCHGIGIFNGVNFAVDASGALFHIGNNRPRERGPGTHAAAWAALSGWSDQMNAASVFLKSVQFRGVSLLDSIDAVWPSATGAPLVSRVIENWGIDLRRSAEEHESRNVSSYCAHAFNSAPSQLEPRLELVQSIWRSLEPDGRGGFPFLDRYLLRRLMELMTQEQARIAPQQHLWQTAYRRLDPQVREFVAQDFLERRESPNDLLVFTHAESTEQGDVHAMVSRALLLLRSATAVVRTAFLDAQFDLETDDLQAWFDTVGIDRGFWSANQPPDELEALWDDVSHAVDDLDQYVSANLGDQLSFVASMRDQVVFLTQAERACIWGVGV